MTSGLMIVNADEEPIESLVARRSLQEFVRRSGLRSLVVGTSKDPNAKITLLLISAESGRPAVALKAPTTDGAASAIDAETRVLLELSRTINPPLSHTIPRIVDALEYHDRSAVAMTALPGTPMASLYFRRRHSSNVARVTADFVAAESWLADLQAATATTRTPMAMDVEIEARLRARFRDDEGLDADVALFAETHSRLRRNKVPRTVVHGDFWFGNILLADGRVTGVIDWESGALSGEPVRDLVRFALMYALYLDHGTRGGRAVAGHSGLRTGVWGAGVEYALDGSGWFPELFRGFLQRGLTRLGASPLAWRDAAVAGIAEVAAFTDHPEFARLHLELFRRVACGTRHSGKPYGTDGIS
jgi:aminoglycoside phosphotransferase